MADPTAPEVNPRSSVDERVIKDLQYLRNIFAHSQELLTAGAADEYAVFLAKLHANPERSILRMLIPLANDLKVVIDSMAVRFFQERKDLLHSVFSVEHQDLALEYLLVPKERNAATRYELNDFFSAYLQTQFPDYVPVTFRIVSEELAAAMRDELSNVLPINFA